MQKRNLVNQKEAAKFLGVSRQTVAKWTDEKRFNSYPTKKGTHFYSKDDLVKHDQTTSDILSRIESKLDKLINTLSSKP